MTAAVEILTERKFSELPVVDSQGRPVGMIDVTDVVAMLPQRSIETPTQSLFSEEPFERFEPLGIRLYTGECAADEPEFVWPFNEMPETD
jgi:CBS domain containing-hemolysin-like protein